MTPRCCGDSARRGVPILSEQGRRCAPRSEPSAGICGTIRKLADLVIDTSKFNVHELRAHLTDRFKQALGEPADNPCFLREFWIQARRCRTMPTWCLMCASCPILILCRSFARLPDAIPRVAKYIRSFPQTQEFINRISELLIYLLPHYIREGKSYLTISFGCTGGQHRSVMIAEEVRNGCARRDTK